MRTLTVTECLICGAEFDLGSGIIPNELIVCPECFREFEVIDVDPLRLEFSLHEEEDWGD